MESFFKYLETRDAFVRSVAAAIIDLLGHRVVIALLHVVIFAAPAYVFRKEIDSPFDLLLYAGLGGICLAIFSFSLWQLGRKQKINSSN